jgi:hypothetical protein
MIRTMLLAVVLVMSISPAGTADAAPHGRGRDGRDRTDSSVVLGDDLDPTVTVSNTTDRRSVDLIAHLDITDPASSSSVDRTIQPISPGAFSVYAVALGRDTGDVAASGVLTVLVADRRSLDPGGILPVALAMPLLVGGLLVARTMATKRAARPVSS